MRNADAVYIDVIRKAGLYDAIWQAFAVLLEVKGVNRVVYDMTSKPPGTIEWE